MLGRRPGLTATIVIVMALGIGTSTAVFSVVDHVLLRPLDLPESEDIVAVCQTHPQGSQWCGASPPNAHDWERNAHSLVSVGIGRINTMALRDDRGATNINVGISTPGFLRSLGVAPALGRLLADDDVPPAGPGRVVVLAHDFWAARFGADSSAVGRGIDLDGETYEIVGVLPAGLRIPRLDFAQAWRPLPFDPANEEYRDWRGFFAMGRLAPGATLADARSELTAIHSGIVEAHPDVLAGSGVTVRRMREYLVASARGMLFVFLGAVLVVLAIVTVNVASLLLARATAREREFAIRTALGATRGTLARQLLVESGVLAVIGGVGGILVGLWATDLFLTLAPPGIPRLDEVGVDFRVLVFSIVATALAAVVFGLAPLFRLRQAVLATGLREGQGLSGGKGVKRTRQMLVVTQLALALVLLVGGGLLFRSFAALLQWEPGFETEHVLTFQLFPNNGRYPEADQVLEVYRQAEARLAALPGVERVGTVSAGPLFGGGDGTTPMAIAGRPALPRDLAPTAAWYDMSPDYFSTLGVPLRAGRLFAETDVAGTAPVALVNGTFARRHWPDGSPVGARVSFPQLDDRSVEIVGVVGDIQPFDAAEQPEPEIYFSNRQFTRWATYFVLRTSVDPATLAGAVATTLQRIDPELSPSRVQTLSELAARARVGPRFNLVLVGLFAAVALVLGVVGIYGVMTYSVVLRTREIGVRMALGADRHRVLRWIGAEGLRIIAAGVVLGTAGALLFSRLLTSMLHGVSATDPIAFGATVTILVAAALAACLVPAVRASRIEPTVAIREL